MCTKESYEKSAQENRNIARQWSERGEHAKADEAIRRALDDDRSKDSLLYRWFGW